MKLALGFTYLLENKDISFGLLKYILALNYATEFLYYKEIFKGKNGLIVLEPVTDY